MWIAVIVACSLLHPSAYGCGASTSIEKPIVVPGSPFATLDECHAAGDHAKPADTSEIHYSAICIKR